jgi:hypothetical protein
MDFKKHNIILIPWIVLILLLSFSQGGIDTAFKKTFYTNVSIIRDGYKEFCTSNRKMFERDEGAQGYLFRQICREGNDSSKIIYENIDPIQIIYGMDGIFFNQFMVFQKFVKDTGIASIMIECLAVNDKYAARQAAKFCCLYLHPNLLEYYSERIHQKINHFPMLSSVDSLKYIPLLFPNAIKNKTVQMKSVYSTIGKIIAGDSLIIDSLILQFKSEREFNKKSDIAMTLGYLDTKKCLLALFSEMNSDVHLTQKSGARTSIRLPILQSISRYYPDDTLFNKYLAIFERHGDPLYMLVMQNKLPKDDHSIKMLLLFPPTKNDHEIQKYVAEYLLKVYAKANDELGIKLTISNGQTYISERKPVTTRRK